MKRIDWINKCIEWKDKWPVYLPEHADDHNGLNIYEVLESVSERLTEHHLVVTDAGSPSYACPTNLKATTPGQFIFNPSQADMGWAIPASIGVALNAMNKVTFVIVGDGSFYTNMQELAVIRQYDLPIKIIVLNNNGYLSIRNTQTKYFEGRVYGVDNNTGLFFADLKNVAETFDLSYELISNRNELRSLMGSIANSNSPEIVEIKCKDEQEILPAQAFKKLPDGTTVQAPLHDMLPFLSEDEMKKEWPK